MRIFPSLFNASDRFVGRPINRSSLDRLPNDVLVDNVFSYLEIFDILRLRKCSKLYYELTHKPIIWKRLLLKCDVPLPPLPPTERNTLKNMSGLEVERLLIRAYSLDKNWKSPHARVFRKWTFDANYRMVEMKQLPGGQYLVASVTTPGENQYSLVVYRMDTMGSARAVAAIDTVAKAYSIQAKYMSIQGKQSIVIAFLRREYHHKTDKRAVIKGHRQDASLFSTHYKIDPEIEFRYACIVMHVPLENLEYLADIPHPTDTAKYREEAASLPRPFKNLVLLTTRKELKSPVLADMFGKPYLAVAKGDNDIAFKQLGGGAVAFLTCADQPTQAQRRHHIKAIQLLPLEHAVLVVREVDTPRTPSYCFEKFPALRCGTVKKIQMHSPIDHTIGRRLGTLSHIYIPEPSEFLRPSSDLVSPWVRAGQPPPGHAEPPQPPPISVVAHRADEEMFVRILFPPRRILVPLGAYGSHGATGAYTNGAGHAAAPATDDSDMMSVTEAAPSVPRYRVTYKYSMDYGRTMRWSGSSNPNLHLRILPAHRRPLIFSYTWDEISDAPLVLSVQPIVDRGWEVHGPHPVGEDGLVEHPLAMVHSPWFKEGGPSDLGLRVRTFAWEETIGRLLVAEEGKEEVTVYDFADGPRQDEMGQRAPLPLKDIQDTDVPMNPCEKPGSAREQAAKKMASQRSEMVQQNMGPWLNHNAAAHTARL